MITRRSSLGLVLGASALALAATPAAAEVVTEDAARGVLDPWADATFTGDPAIIADFLAPEYQLQRANGTGATKDEYLKILPKKAIRNSFSNIVATGNDEVMVIRYLANSEQIIEGAPVKGVAPRLSVFRREDRAWLMVAHANFAPMG